MSDTILVIDDDRMTRVLLKRRLGRDGFDVAFAESGTRGLEMVEQNQYSLILLDLVMPRFSGLDFLRAVKGRVNELPPIIMLSADHDTQSINECLALGATDFLAKPIIAAALAAKIRDALSGQSASAAV